MTPHALSDIQFQTTLEGVTPAQLGGFFKGWPSPPAPATLWRILDRSAAFVLARTPDRQVIGLVNVARARPRLRVGAAPAGRTR